MRQRVEILEAPPSRGGVLILDEPTAVLTPNEVAALFGLLRRFSAADKAVVIVTHKLHEVMAMADRVIVLRDDVAGEVATGATEAALARLMVGRDLAAPASRRAAPASARPWW